MAIIIKDRKVKSATKYDSWVVHGATSKPLEPTPYSMERLHNVRYKPGGIKPNGEPFLGWNPTLQYSIWMEATFKRIGIGDVERIVMNKAISSYKNKLDSNNGFIETWVERQKSIDMATDAAKFLRRKLKQVVRDARLVRRKPWLADRVLSKYKAQLRHQILHKDGLSDIPMMYLAYNFGIAPTISTIADTATLLTQPFPEFTLKGGGKMAFSISMDYPGQQYHYYFGGNVYAKVQSTCWGVNPNVYLAQQLGVFTPSVAWELVPWSWLIDYGTNVGNWIGNLDPSPPGLKLKDAFNTIHVKANNVWFEMQPSNPGEYDVSKPTLTGQYVSTYRDLGVPTTSLEIPSLRDFNLRKFSLAMAALTLTFKDSSFLQKNIPGTKRKR